MTRPLDALAPGSEREGATARDRSIYVKAPVMLHSLDADGNIASVSDLWLTSLGYTRDEVIGRPAIDFLTTESAQAAANECIPRFFASGRLDAEPLQFVKKNGEVIDALLSAAAERDANGEIVGSISVVTDVTARLEAERRARHLHGQLFSVLDELSQVEEQERQRIASDLHDRVGQGLVIARMKLAEVNARLGTAGSGTDLEELAAALDQALVDTRTLTYEISPPILYEVGLEAALEWLVTQLSERHALPIELRSDGSAQSLPQPLQILAFKAAQELLTNVVKHADACRAWVALELDGRFLKLRVEDDGVGAERIEEVSRMDSSGGFGLFSIRNRTAYFGGETCIGPGAVGGTRVELRLPVDGGRGPDHGRSEVTLPGRSVASRPETRSTCDCG